MLANGVEFDNTYEQGNPTTLRLDDYLVPGLKEALLLMKEGDEWRVTIPARLGFGGGRMVRDGEELSAALRELLSDSRKRTGMGDRARAFVERNRGALNQVLERIDTLLRGSP